MSATRPGNYCVSCGTDFSSLALFDAHRVGKHEYGPEHPLGRRCLSEAEMREKGWKEDGRGRMSDPQSSERARARFS